MAYFEEIGESEKTTKYKPEKGGIMKKLFSIILCLILCMLAFVSCDNGTSKEDSSEDGSLDTEVESESSNFKSDNEDETTTKFEDSENAPVDTQNQGTIQIVQAQKYYREIASGYSDENTFIDGVFEMNNESQYKIISSKAELQEFTLLQHESVEDELFENNYIVAILHYYIGPSVSSKIFVGFYNADLKNEQKILLDTFYNYQYDSTTDMRNNYSLHFIVVPKIETSHDAGIKNITISENEIEQYNMTALAIANSTEKTKAYYINNESRKNELEILDSISKNFMTYPSIAIHLNEVISSDYLVNGFKYENGEIFITVEIYEKNEMILLHQENANLLIISLIPHNASFDIIFPDEIPTDCKVNVIFKNITSVN